MMEMSDFDSEVSVIEYRVENKYIVSDLDIAIISKRLKTIMKQDIHQNGDCYEIRSLYFDDVYDSCMEDNDAGLDCRKKYRIRTYDSENSPINLEIKEKRSGLTKKVKCDLSRKEYEAICNGTDMIGFGEKEPLNQLLLQMRCVNMRPKIIIAYKRTAFVHPSGNVRITFDRNIVASKKTDCFFESNILGMIPILPIGMHVLEVKYDELLPEQIAQQLEIGKLRQTAFSKYYLGRLAAEGDFLMSI